MNISTIQRYRREGSGRAAVAGTAASTVKVNFSLRLTESRGYQMGQSGGCDHRHARKKPRQSPVSRGFKSNAGWKLETLKPSTALVPESRSPDGSRPAGGS